MTIKNDLAALNRDIKAVGKKVDSLLKTVENSGKTNLTKPSKARTAKTKTSKKFPTKKVSTKKKAAGLTATDQVLRIIKRSKNGVDTDVLMKKTGFFQRKIWSIINRASKAGKIQRIERGVYIGVKES